MSERGSTVVRIRLLLSKLMDMLLVILGASSVRGKRHGSRLITDSLGRTLLCVGLGKSKSASGRGSVPGRPGRNSRQPCRTLNSGASERSCSKRHLIQSTRI